jgi:uncharacterized protein (TIGR03066 family)
MRSFSRQAGVFCIAVVLLALTACSGKKGVKPDDLTHVSIILINECDGSNKGVASIEQLEASPNARDLPKSVFDQIRSEDIVVPWKVNLSKLAMLPGGLGSYVIVYEKDAPTKGGYVVMGLEKAKKVTAEEFKTLKLAHDAADAGKVWTTESEKRTADKLVGTWELTKGSGMGPVPGTTMEFSPPAVIVRYEAKGKREKKTWNYKIEGETIVVIPAGDAKKDKLTIKTLTGSKLVTEDEQGNAEEYKKSSD